MKSKNYKYCFLLTIICNVAIVVCFVIGLNMMFIPLIIWTLLAFDDSE